jgi:hypothetical protein
MEVQEIRESDVCTEWEGYANMECSTEENPGLSKY